MLKRALGGLGWSALLLLWLFVVALAFAVSTALGVLAAVVLVVWIAGEIWLRRRGGRLRTIAVVWVGSWRVGWGVLLIETGAAAGHGWGTVILVVLGSLQLGLGIAFLAVAIVGRRRVG